MSLYGKCTNVGICNKASTKEIIAIESNKAFECPECNAELHFSAPKEFTLLQKTLPIGLVIFMLGIAGIWAIQSTETYPAPTTRTAIKNISENKHRQKITSDLLTQSDDLAAHPAPDSAKAGSPAQEKPLMITVKSDFTVTETVVKKTLKTRWHTRNTRAYNQVKSVKTLVKHHLPKHSHPIVLAQTDVKQLQNQPAPQPSQQISESQPVLDSAVTSKTSVNTPKPTINIYQHHPDSLQKQLALAAQNYLQPDKKKISRVINTYTLQPTLPNTQMQELTTRTNVASHFKTDEKNTTEQNKEILVTVHNSNI